MCTNMPATFKYMKTNGFMAHCRTDVYELCSVLRSKILPWPVGSVVWGALSQYTWVMGSTPGQGEYRSQLMNA